MASDDPKRYDEGPDAAARFDSTLHRILKVSKPELEKREAAYKKSREQKNRPGPRRRSSKHSE